MFMALAILFSPLVSCEILHGFSGDSGGGALMCMDDVKMVGVPCPDSELFYAEGTMVVQKAFMGRDIEELDGLYAKWCSGKDRFPDGRWKLAFYGDGLYDYFSSRNSWSAHLNAIKEWQRKYPNSMASRYAEAVYWHAYAWYARGSGTAGTVQKEGWALYRERIVKALDAVGAIDIKSSPCPAPYPLKIGLMRQFGLPEETILNVYREGIDRFPQYHNIHFNMARIYDPMWGGSAESYERFAQEVARNTRAFEGMGMYARLYWLVDAHHSLPFNEVKHRFPGWKSLRAGYEDLMRIYPNSIHNRSKYLGVICRSRDSKLYRKLREELVGYESYADKEMPESVDVCDLRHNYEPRSK
jgi:hypothetical protein